MMLAKGGWALIATRVGRGAFLSCPLRLSLSGFWAATELISDFTARQSEYWIGRIINKEMNVLCGEKFLFKVRIYIFFRRTHPSSQGCDELCC